jgi:hypothetical protein
LGGDGASQRREWWEEFLSGQPGQQRGPLLGHHTPRNLLGRGRVYAHAAVPHALRCTQPQDREEGTVSHARTHVRGHTQHASARPRDHALFFFRTQSNRTPPLAWPHTRCAVCSVHPLPTCPAGVGASPQSRFGCTGVCVCEPRRARGRGAAFTRTGKGGEQCRAPHLPASGTPRACEHPPLKARCGP